MENPGFIKDKLDVKFLILFILKHIERPVPFPVITEMAMIDKGFGFFELSEAFYEMVDSEHISQTAEGSPPLYQITAKGRETSDLYLSRLPSSIRQAAQRTVIKGLSRLRRDSQIGCATARITESHFETSLSLSDGNDEIISLKLLTVNAEQSAMIETNFKKNAEAIYNEILAALLKDYK